MGGVIFSLDPVIPVSIGVHFSHYVSIGVHFLILKKKLIRIHTMYDDIHQNVKGKQHDEENQSERKENHSSAELSEQGVA